MPKNKVIDLITDQELAFARLVLSGTMNDRDAAQAAGLKPDTAAYTKAKPRVREYMLEHRAAVQQLLVEQEAAHEAEELRLRCLRRERVLDRLFVIADASSEMTRGGFTSQVKALALIAAMDGQIPDRRAGSATTTSPQRAASPQSNPPRQAAKLSGRLASQPAGENQRP